ncbi:alpha-N-acetylgalactosaminide alpha-2,6-sialyltransferase 1-like [Ptychodera flava]|uniref:alpha-N-acetylgalactosaminide alpha-2,6-sialyltransferase 1-like n=1 Tax=Ptychodera flava TaxID=63121 RepID=UPI00396A1599
MPYMTNVHHKPSTCVRYPRKSIWFMTRYIPNIKVFMDKEDINNFTNYYKLSHYRLPFGVKGQDRRLLGRLLNNPNLTNPDVLIENESRRCVRCAVVGLGGVLNGSDMGRTIDGHDYVFRVNRALTKDGFAQDVGTRTSFYTFFPESQYTKEIQDPSVMLFYVIYRPYDIAYAMAMLGNDTPPFHTYDNGQTYRTPSKPKLDVRKLKIIHPDFMRYVFTRFLDSKANWPTTGT